MGSLADNEVLPELHPLPLQVVHFLDQGSWIDDDAVPDDALLPGPEDPGRDEMEDVTKRKGGSAMASFYGNMNRNVAMGGADENDRPDEAENPTKKSGENDSGSAFGFLDGFERAGGGDKTADEQVNDVDEGNTGADEGGTSTPGKDGSTVVPKLDPVAQNLAMRKVRAEKLAKARARYFERQGITPQ